MFSKQQFCCWMKVSQSDSMKGSKDRNSEKCPPIYILAGLSCEFHHLHMVYIWKWGSNTNKNRPQISKVLVEIKMFLVSEKEQDGQEKDFHTADHRREESTGEENQQNFIFLVLVWKVAPLNQIINESWFMSPSRDEVDLGIVTTFVDLNCLQFSTPS